MSDSRPLSERAAEAIAAKPGMWGGHLTAEHRMDAAKHALAATIDGVTLADLLDLAQDCIEFVTTAAHDHGCSGGDGYPCKCGLTALLARLEADR